MDGPARHTAGERIARVPPRGRGARLALAALAIVLVGVVLGVVATLYGAPACLALLYVEESGVPLPVPGDVYVVYLGTLSAGSLAKLAGAWLAIIAVVVAGATNLYLISRRWAHQLITGRVGQLLHLDPERLARVERWLSRWGALAIIFGRHVPGMRVPITVLAGTFGVRYRVFAPSVAVSTAIWAGVWLALAARFGPSVAGVLTRHRSLYLAALGAAVLVLALVLVRAWRSSGRRPGREPSPGAG
jgi:membrane-associated protein